MTSRLGASILLTIVLFSGYITYASGGVGGSGGDESRGVALKAGAAMSSTGSSTLAVHCGKNPIMTLSCYAEIGIPSSELEGGLSEVYLRWAPHYNPTFATYARVNLTLSDDDGGNDDSALVRFTTTLYRMRPSTTYTVELLTSDGSVAASEQAYVGDTGISSEIDNGMLPLAPVEGKPTFELLLFAYKKGTFEGLLAVDRAGFVVFYVNASSSSPNCDATSPSDCGTSANGHIEAFAQVKTGPFAGTFCVNNDVNTLKKNGVLLYRADGGNAASISEVDLPASLDRQDSFEGHECRPTDGGNILVTGYVKQRIVAGGATVDAYSVDITETFREFFLEWDPKANVIEKTVFVNDLEPLPVVINALHTHAEANKSLDIEISHDDDNDDDFINGTSEAMMYLHISAVSVSWDGALYIISMRDAETVVALHRVSLELAWRLSSSLPESTFAFESDDDRFYQPHDGKLFAPLSTHPHSDGTLCLIDDGGTRPGCKQKLEPSDSPTDDGECYSRAVCFALDVGNGTAIKTFDFSYPNAAMTNAGDGTGFADLSTTEKAQDLYNLNGGAIQELHDGYFVAFTSVYKAPFSNYSWAFQTKQTGEVTAIAKLPHIVQWLGGASDISGLYRVEALNSLSGESSRLDDVGIF